MNDLLLNKTWIDNCGVHPLIYASLDKQVINVDGELYSACANEYFEPLYAWINTYFETSSELLVINFKLTYYNTIGFKIILKLVEFISKHRNNSLVNWFYIENDENLKKDGEYLLRQINLSGSVVPYS